MKNNSKGSQNSLGIGSVGLYHGSGLPTKYGTRRFSASMGKPAKTPEDVPLNRDKSPRKFN